MIEHARITVDDVPGDDVIVLDAGCPWRVAWDLIIRGPFHEALLEDGGRYRWVTPASLLRAAVCREPSAADLLTADDFDVAEALAPSLPLADAARVMAQQGVERALCPGESVRLLTSKTVMRALMAEGRQGWDLWP